MYVTLFEDQLNFLDSVQIIVSVISFGVYRFYQECKESLHLKRKTQSRHAIFIIILFFLHTDLYALKNLRE